MNMSTHIFGIGVAGDRGRRNRDGGIIGIDTGALPSTLVPTDGAR